MRCATCNGLLTGDKKKGRYVYYACRGSKGCKRFYRETALEAVSLRALQSLAIDEAISEWITTELATWYDDTTNTTNATTRRLEQRLTELERLKAASYEEKLLGRIDEAAWRAHSARWQAEVAELKVALNTSAPCMSKDDFLRRVRSPLELVQTAAREYVTQPMAEKARFLRTLCSNYTASDGTITLQMRSPFDALANAAGKWEFGWETGTRTPIQRSRAACPTIERSPSSAGRWMLHGG